jgi:hypothetical protein
VIGALTAEALRKVGKARSAKKIIEGMNSKAINKNKIK